MKQIKDHYVFTSFEISKQLDELESFKEFSSEYHDYYYNKNGEIIDAEISLFYDNNFPAITQSQAQKYFREIHNVDIIITPKYKDLGKFYGGYLYNHQNVFNKSFGSNYKTYEESLEIGIVEALELIDV